MPSTGLANALTLAFLYVFNGFIGAAEGIRTPDPRITNALLYQLSYRGLYLISLKFLSSGSAETSRLLPLCYPFPVRRLSRAVRSAASTRLAASSCIPGRTWEYRSSVIATVAWPSRSCAIFGWTPLASKCVAWLCRRSWKRILGKAVATMKRTNSWVRLFGFRG